MFGALRRALALGLLVGNITTLPSQLQALQTWDAWECENSLDEIQRAMLGALQDAAAEVRSTARDMWAVYAEAWPDRVRALAPTLEPHILAKLQQALAPRGKSARPYFAST